MGFMHLGLNAAEKEAVMTQQSVVPCVLLCHIQTWHLFLQWSQLPVCLSFAVKSGVSFSDSLSCQSFSFLLKGTPLLQFDVYFSRTLSC